ncbi:GNAT family N-acetyltransferase [Guptibacillus algicola]|uniref:GNAT family N-acetyltransferase n=1 Tax=Guptibacillus algicola TaxID=225844 RepID=UPI001CD39A0C|nr:GNAT family N-acetyltransferase [Alkalihalobacillus algicola]MCA0989287.1 GNAT family N-acetyltransferase [Alkalihalobacillus algicola]
MTQHNFHPFPVLHTERLSLRKLSSSDVASIYNYHCNKEHFPYVDMVEHHTLEDSRKFIKKMNEGVEENKWVIWAIADASTDTILGTISLWNLSSDGRKGELGYGLHPGNTGKGLMTEALAKVLHFGFYTMGLETIEAYTNEDHQRSISLLDKHGFTKIKTVTEKGPSGKLMNLAVFEKKSE